MKLALLQKIIRHQNNMKFRAKLLLSFSLLAVFPVVFVGAMSTYYSQKYLLETETNALAQSMYQLSKSLDYFFQTYMDRSNMVSNSEDLLELMETDASRVDVAVSLNKKLGKLITYIESDFLYPEMENYFGGYGKIVSKLYIDNDTVTSYGIALPYNTIMDQEWVHALFKGPRAFLWHYGDVINNEVYVSLSRRLVNFDNAKDAGLLQTFIPVKRIQKIIETNLKNSNIGVFYLDDGLKEITSAGNKNYCNDFYYQSILKLKLEDGVNPVKIGSDKIIVGCMTSTSTKWKVVYLIPLKNVTGKTGIISLITFFTIIVALIICSLIALGISTIITRRIKILLDKTNEIDGNNLSTSLVVKGNDELSQLDKNFDKMILRIRNLIENVYIAQIDVNQTKLELLQEQINPHLLYNSLSMIASTAEKEGRNDITEVVENLSAFYRGVLNRGQIVYTFREELDTVERYIEIVKSVYKLDIDAIFAIDDEVLDFYTIKLLIQPVIENSILHGIRPKKQGTIAISGSIENDTILISISDDGIGMDAAAVDYLNGRIVKNGFDKSYGMTNVTKRVKMLLGESYGLKCTSTLNEGTTVTFTLPKIASGDINTLVKEKFLEQ